MNAEEAAALRKPFEDHQIGTLPKGGTKLSFVGHAAVTDRLLAVDPLWWWEPMAVDERGLPLIEYGKTEAVMWIKLHVCNMTRLGVGTCAVNGFELHKQLISDAIRNAAMRFGVALDLWSKEELHPAEKPVKRRSGKVGNESPAATASGEPSKPATVPSPAASRACHTCGEPITGAVLVLEGQKYHKTDECRPGNPLANEARAALAGQNVEHS